jgi:hypothetical protein
MWLSGLVLTFVSVNVGRSFISYQIFREQEVKDEKVEVDDHQYILETVSKKLSKNSHIMVFIF